MELLYEIGVGIGVGVATPFAIAFGSKVYTAITRGKAAPDIDDSPEN